MQIMSLHQLRNNALIFNPIKSSKQHLLESKQGKKVENLNQGIFQLVRSDHLCITRSKIFISIFKKIVEEPYNFYFFHIVLWHLPSFGIIYISEKNM
jgi:hypothetical protein